MAGVSCARGRSGGREGIDGRACGADSRSINSVLPGDNSEFGK